MLAGLAFVIVVVVGVYLIGRQAPRVETPQAGIKQEIPQPEYTPGIAAALEKSTGFQHLVSYTGEAFEPNNLAIKKGETVRFVNNSLDLLWVASTGDGGHVYPGQSPDCGQSDFDSCVLVRSGTFWEFTFDISGTWTYKNNANVSRAGAITVSVP